jgi:hypothetical protein
MASFNFLLVKQEDDKEECYLGEEKECSKQQFTKGKNWVCWKGDSYILGMYFLAWPGKAHGKRRPRRARMKISYDRPRFWTATEKEEKESIPTFDVPIS